jgi:prepilin-type N-terminal cleavage/methylation domain-containing protein/prepilin-type processing-associated H-X9-DG protein
MRRRTSRRAFTLVELLVVTAILSLLAGILFPVFAQAREKARQTTCLSNMKQLGLAANLYLLDWEGGFPQTHTTAEPWVRQSRRDRLIADWFQLLYPYSHSTGINVCPSDPNVTARRPNSYIPNGYFVYGAHVGVVPNPTETIYLYESADDNGDYETKPWLGMEEIEDEDVAVKRHHGGANYLFCDWHVRWLHFEQTLAPVNMHVPGG